MVQRGSGGVGMSVARFVFIEMSEPWYATACMIGGGPRGDALPVTPKAKKTANNQTYLHSETMTQSITKWTLQKGGVEEEAALANIRRSGQEARVGSRRTADGGGDPLGAFCFLLPYGKLICSSHRRLLAKEPMTR